MADQNRGNKGVKEVCSFLQFFQAKSLISDLNVMIMNYLVRGGYPSAAVSFAREANLALSKESMESITARMEVRNKIHAGDIEGAIHDINRLNPQVIVSTPCPCRCVFVFFRWQAMITRSCTTLLS